MEFKLDDFLKDPKQVIDGVGQELKRNINATMKELQPHIDTIEATFCSLHDDFDRQLDELLKAWKLDTLQPTSTDIPSESKIKNQEHWTQSKFNQRMRDAARCNAALLDAPKSISLKGFAKSFEQMGIDTIKDGRERGRMVYSDLNSADLVLGKLSIGDEGSVSVEHSVSFRHWHRALKPVMTVHTHPRGAWEPLRSIEHFSDADIQQLVCSRDINGIIMISEGVSFLAVRSSTGKSRASDSEFEKRMAPLRTHAKRRNFRTGDYARILTKSMCIEFGLTLYVATPDDRTLFKRVDLGV